MKATPRILDAIETQRALAAPPSHMTVVRKGDLRYVDTFDEYAARPNGEPLLLLPIWLYEHLKKGYHS